MGNEHEDSIGMHNDGQPVQAEKAREILKQLSPLERSCLLLSLDADFTPEEIAEILNINQKDVNDILNRGDEEFFQIYYDNTVREEQENDKTNLLAYRRAPILPDIELSPELLLKRIQHLRDYDPGDDIHDLAEENRLLGSLFCCDAFLEGHHAHNAQVPNQKVNTSQQVPERNKTSRSALEDQTEQPFEALQVFNSRGGSQRPRFESTHIMQIGKYRLLVLLSERCLSEHRYTEVWLGEDIDLKKKVAIKILFPQDICDNDARLHAKKQFVNEAQTLRQLAHPHIVEFVEYGEEEEREWLYFVMEFAPFGSLAQCYRLGERLPLATVRDFVSQIGEAIHHAHAQGLIHRDIKPQNIFLKADNQILLGDFGLVMHDHSEQTVWDFGGTRAYMAPEQEQGKPCPASDQFALATIVFEWLTGQSPFNDAAEKVAWQRKNLAPPSTRVLVPEISTAVDRVVMTALQNVPAHRFKTILDFTREFEEAYKQATVGLLLDTSASQNRVGSFIGSLDQFDLSIILQRIELYKKTGLLVVKQGERRVELSFRQGQLLCIGPVRPDVSLGDRLLQAGVISREAYQEVVFTLGAEYYREVGAALTLIDQGHVNQQSLYKWAFNEASYVIEVLIAWTEGEIYFEENQQPPSDRLLIALPISSLLPEQSSEAFAQAVNACTASAIEQQHSSFNTTSVTQSNISDTETTYREKFTLFADTTTIAPFSVPSFSPFGSAFDTQCNTDAISGSTAGKLLPPQPVTTPATPTRVNTTYMQPHMILTPADLSAYRERNPQIVITPDQWQLFTRADGKTTLQMAAQELGMSRDQVCQVAGELVALSIITLSLPAYGFGEVNELPPVSREYIQPSLSNGMMMPGYTAPPAQHWDAAQPSPNPQSRLSLPYPIETHSQWGDGGNGATFVLGNGWVVAPSPLQSDSQVEKNAFNELKSGATREVKNRIA